MKFKTLAAAACMVMGMAGGAWGDEFILPSGFVSDTYEFSIIPEAANTYTRAVEGQLSVTVWAENNSSTSVNFTFFNNVGNASSISEIYFDDGTLLGISAINSSGDADVKFYWDGEIIGQKNNGDDLTNTVSPGDLPGGNTIGFVTTAHFLADSVNPQVQMGVDQSSEWVTINFSLKDDQTYSDTIDALTNSLSLEPLRIGIHVTGISGLDADGNPYDYSAGYVAGYGFGDLTPAPTPSAPLPSVAAVVPMMLVGFGLVRRRRNA